MSISIAPAVQRVLDCRDDSIRIKPSEAFAILERFENLLASGRIVILPTTSKVTYNDLRNVIPEGPICVCDFHVHNITEADETFPGDHQLKSYGIVRGDILNIDHHANIKSMQRAISSGVLATEYIHQHGSLPEDYTIVTNHADCDSVLSLLIISGLLKPNATFNEAVIAADHTGESNAIAELLQGLEAKRNFRLSVQQLLRFLQSDKPSSEAAQALGIRQSKRELVEELLNTPDAITTIGRVTLVKVDRSIDSELLVPLLPHAEVIMIYEKRPEDAVSNSYPNTHLTRLRLGLLGMERGLNLLDLKVQDDIDPNWGGRWNAGSSSRGGGFPNEMDILKSVQLLAAKLQEDWLKTQ